MYVGCRRKSSVVAVVELPAAQVLPRVGLGFVGWGVCGGAVNLLLQAVAPTLSL
jgi:hypothetical protein